MIRSNIKDVIGRMERAQRRIPGKIAEAFDAQQYFPELKDLAEAVLNATADTDVERMAIPILMSQMSASSDFRKMIFSMGGLPFNALSKAFDPQQNPLHQIAREEVINWVRYHKVKDHRDQHRDGTPYTDAEIATRVIAAIKEDPEPWLRVDQAGKGALNPEGLVQFAGITGLSASKLDQMLRTVLAAWNEYMREIMPATVKQKLREAFE